jgi:hypothetical protein
MRRRSASKQKPAERELWKCGNLAEGRRDSHISTAPTVHTCFRQNDKQEKKLKSVGHGKVEIQNEDSHFPTAPTACGSKEENH